MKIVRFKPGVKIGRYSPPVEWILRCLYSVVMLEKSSDIPDEVWVTSINDSVHGSKSRHYTDEAFDLRSKNFASLELKHKFAERLMKELNNHPTDPNKFTVILEDVGKGNEHFHVQVKKGKRFLGWLQAA